MRIALMFLALVLALGSWADARGRRAKETRGEREACTTPHKPTEGDEFRGPRAVHRAPVLGPSELKRWGPVEVNAVIDCKGWLTSIEVEGTAPGEVVQKVRRKLKTWRFEPARFEGQPVAVEYVLTLATGNR